MKRYSERRTINVKPVIKVQLSEKKVKIRIALMIFLIVVAGISIPYALISLLSGENGWVAIEVSSTSEMNCSDEFVFLYDIGAAGVSASVEKKALISIYTDAAVNAYRIFNNDMVFDGVNNVAYINQHPNEVIQVDDVLYKAFSVLAENNNRSIYMAPIYHEYDNLFQSENDSQTFDFDVYQNNEVRQYFDEVLPYIQDADSVELELLGDNQVMLKVSDEYLQYAEDSYITNFIDFYWMKNAFIIDYFADVMTNNNYTLGSFSSFNGFVRNLDQREQTYSYNIYDRVGETVYSAGIMQYTGAKSIVNLRNYRMTTMDNKYFYEMDNGEIRTSYIDISDGLCKSSINDLLLYSKETECAEILMRSIPIYIADSFQEDELWELYQQNIYSVYMREHSIYYNDANVSITDLLNKEDILYTMQQVVYN